MKRFFQLYPITIYTHFFCKQSYPTDKYSYASRPSDFFGEIVRKYSNERFENKIYTIEKSRQVPKIKKKV